MGRGLVTLGLGDAEGNGLPDDPDTGPAPITGPVAPPRARPGGMAVSAILHAVLLALAVQVAIVHAPEAPRPVARTPRADAVFLPPPAQVRKMLGLRPPPPPPPPSGGKDRISVGAASAMRPTERLDLRREDDLTKVAKGVPTASQIPRSMEAAPPPPAPVRAAGAMLSEGGRLLPTPLPPGRPGPLQASLRRFEAGGVGDPGPLGITTGTGGQMGALSFDPQGADFTEWAQRFKNEVYRNWIVPPAAIMGWGGGEVQFQFVVDRSGAVSDVTLVSSSGIPAYDRAARNALLSSRLFVLPADYGPATLTINVVFGYGTARPSDAARSGR
jgi:TonB family protein